jgi:hypothetical protein
MKLKNPYIISNIIFAGIILLIIVYSGFFSSSNDGYLVKSACPDNSSSICISKGLSRSFSEIVRFNFEAARSYNKHGISIFLFFVIQFFMRSLFLLLAQNSTNSKRIVIIDILISIFLFIFTFRNFIVIPFI